MFLRNRLKYALTGDEVKRIVKQRLIKVDGKVRTDTTYPAGFMGEGGGRAPSSVVDCALYYDEDCVLFRGASGSYQ